MRLLLLGGTVFVGRALAEAALERGHRLTLFNRGRTNPELLPAAEHVRGDRDGGLAVLDGRRFDAVLDTSGYLPRLVAASARLAAGAAERYLFVSTASVYADLSATGIAEDARLHQPRWDTEDVTGESYGPLKVACERAVEEALPRRSLIVRPGLVAGPNDPSDRFTYWPGRIAAGGDVLVPGRPDRRLQLIDARDLAAWMLTMVEAGESGVFNATGPLPPLTMGGLVESCLRVSGSDARPVWAGDAFLLEHGVEPWSELPLWLPDDEEHRGLAAIDAAAALERGLAFRPIDETVADTLAWDRERPPGPRRAGMGREREGELLRLLAAQ